MTKARGQFIVFDSNSIIHRAYHALPPLTTKKGELVNAVYGFLLVFLKAVREFDPEFIAAAFDFPAPTFRHKKFKAYKAKRPPTPENLKQQILKVKEVLNAFDVQIFEKEGFEADDIIGTIVCSASKKQALLPIEAIIFSGDLDLLQLVDCQTKAYVLRRGVKDAILYDENLVREKYQGLEPRQLLDFKALKGDPSDNIPGVAGIGGKTAMGLLLEFGTLENLYKNAEESSPIAKRIKSRIKELLLKNKEQAFVSKSLVRIDNNTPLDFSLKKCQWGEYNKDRVIAQLKALEFYSLIDRLPSSRGEESNKQQQLLIGL